jgi:GntR family transcriptional regulator / MocR family aminotransferase
MPVSRTSARSARSPELLLRLDRRSGEPLSAQLERELRAAVRAGRLRPGAPLPSTRSLAAELGVSRGLVVGAYAQLRAEGYLVFRQGAPPRVAGAVAPPVESTWDAPRPRPRYNLRPELPDFGSFPREEWLRSYRAALKRAPDRVFGYGDARGAGALRSELAAYLGRARGVVASPGHMFVCGGFAQAFSLVCGVLRREGRTRLAVEDPGHSAIRRVCERVGMTIVPVPVDAEGLDPARLAGSGADAVLVTPAHQFPTAVVLTPERRAALLSWASETGALIVEDDYDAEYRYDRAPVGALQGLAPARVFYLGSASKTLAPTLRLGWIVPPPDYVLPLVEEVLETIFAAPHLEQLAFADFIARGELDRHLRRMRLVYRRRRDVVVRALARELPQADVRGIAAGLYLVARFPDRYDERRLLDEAARRQIAVGALVEHRIQSEGPPALLLGFGALHDSALRAAVRELGAVVEAASA